MPIQWRLWYENWRKCYDKKSTDIISISQMYVKNAIRDAKHRKGLYTSWTQYVTPSIVRAFIRHGRNTWRHASWGPLHVMDAIRDAKHLEGLYTSWTQYVTPTIVRAFTRHGRNTWRQASWGPLYVKTLHYCNITWLPCPAWGRLCRGCSL